MFVNSIVNLCLLQSSLTYAKLLDPLGLLWSHGRPLGPFGVLKVLEMDYSGF